MKRWFMNEYESENLSNIKKEWQIGGKILRTNQNSPASRHWTVSLDWLLSGYRSLASGSRLREPSAKSEKSASRRYIRIDVKLIQFNSNQVLCKRRVVELNKLKYHSENER